MSLTGFIRRIRGNPHPPTQQPAQPSTQSLTQEKHESLQKQVQRVKDEATLGTHKKSKSKHTHSVSLQKSKRQLLKEEFKRELSLQKDEERKYKFIQREESRKVEEEKRKQAAERAQEIVMQEVRQGREEYWKKVANQQREEAKKYGKYNNTTTMGCPTSGAVLDNFFQGALNEKGPLRSTSAPLDAHDNDSDEEANSSECRPYEILQIMKTEDPRTKWSAARMVEKPQVTSSSSETVDMPLAKETVANKSKPKIGSQIAAYNTERRLKYVRQKYAKNCTTTPSSDISDYAEVVKLQEELDQLRRAYAYHKQSVDKLNGAIKKIFVMLRQRELSLEEMGNGQSKYTKGIQGEMPASLNVDEISSAASVDYQHELQLQVEQLHRSRVTAEEKRELFMGKLAALEVKICDIENTLSEIRDRATKAVEDTGHLPRIGKS